MKDEEQKRVTEACFGSLFLFYFIIWIEKDKVKNRRGASQTLRICNGTFSAFYFETTLIHWFYRNFRQKSVEEALKKHFYCQSETTERRNRRLNFSLFLFIYLDKQEKKIHKPNISDLKHMQDFHCIKYTSETERTQEVCKMRRALKKKKKVNSWSETQKVCTKKKKKKQTVNLCPVHLSVEEKAVCIVTTFVLEYWEIAEHKL